MHIEKLEEKKILKSPQTYGFCRTGGGGSERYWLVHNFFFLRLPLVLRPGKEEFLFSMGDT